MDGLLVIDKPSGPTSHDVVARMRRVLRERRIGHTGTLDPVATGVLPLVIGRATRLARFLSAGDKSYEAIIRLGFATDTADTEGAPISGRYEGPLPADEAVDRALDAFRGQILQNPPAFSAKKIAGRRSYDLARRGPTRARLAVTPPHSDSRRASVRLEADPEVAPLPAAVRVTAHAIDIVELNGDRLRLRVDCSAGFYVRSLAHDLGERLGTGAHLVGLRRIQTGEYSIADALPLDMAERDPDRARQRIVPMAGMLTKLPAISLDDEAVVRAVHGRDLETVELRNPPQSGIADPESRFHPESRFVRLLDSAGDLVAIAERVDACGLLHPLVVLR